MTKRQRQHELPFSRSELRKTMLEKAGISVSEMAAATKEAFAVMRRNLSAEKTELVSFRGKYEEVKMPDSQSQLRAAETIIDFTGASLSRSESRGESGDVHITIQFPAACQPTPAIDITPAIEALPPEQGAARDE